MPLAAHSLGYMLILVKPGSVLISLITTLLSGVRNTSTRAKPKHSSARKAFSATSRILSLTSGVIAAGTTT
ncbi:hypothetical protein D3C87_1938690 [compost metagenome]